MSAGADLAARMQALLGASATPDPTPAELDAERASLSSLRGDMKGARARAEALADPGHPDRALLLPPDWDALAQAAEAILRNGRKRMEAAAFLLEALTRAHGLPGLAAASSMLGGLVEHHWDSLEPRPAPAADGSQPPARQVAASVLDPMRAVAGDQVPVLLRQIVLFVSSEGVAYTVEACERARRRPAMEARLAEEKKAPRDPRRLATIARLEAELAAPSMRPWDQVAQAARAQQGDTIQAMCEDIRAAQAGWAAFERGLASRAAGGIVPVAPVRDLLASLLALLAPLAPDPPAEVPSDQQEGETPPTFAQTAAQPAAPVRAPATRQQMLAALSDIAQFFHQTEPQSPIAASIEEVVRRARLSWPDLMAEMLPKKEERDTVLQRLGIRPAPPAG
jgi:type VI secretion system protein ImpA